jgi:hypothetical protein
MSITMEIYFFFQTSWSQYPANRNSHINGTKIRIRGMEGVAEESWYDNQLKSLKTPTIFHGYNSDPSYFPFWNSESYTYVTTMLALSTYNNIADSHQSVQN